MGEQPDEGRLDEPPLVVALLRPWVGKQDEDLIETLPVKVTLQHLDSVVANHPDIREPSRLELQQEPPDTGPVHLDAEKVIRRMRRGERQQILAVPKAYLDDAPRGTAARSCADVMRPLRVTKERIVRGW